MGYLTNYRIGLNRERDEATGKLRKPTPPEWAAIESLEKEDFLTDFYGRDCECKWYDHEVDLREFSKKHPDVVFVLHGKGEQDGDLWKKYFKNGRLQTARAEITITYPEYDEAQLG